MVQQVQSAKYPGMLSSALATGLADFVLPAPDMAKQLVAYARGPYLAAGTQVEESVPPDFPEPMQSEIDILFKELLIGVTNFFRDSEAFDC
jgi:two-component system, chemotaxis family, CheB/CheR fusion protein